jgi:hypothetical protein
VKLDDEFRRLKVGLQGCEVIQFDHS